MYQLFYRFWEICRFRSGPQDLPDSQFLVVFSLFGYALVTLLRSLFELSVADSLLATTVDVLLLAVLSYVVLWIKLWPHRWPQTVSALAGTGIILGVLSLPLALWYHAVGPGTSGVLLPALLMLGLLVWNMFVIAHILRHALSVHLLFGGALAAVYLYLSIRVMSALFFPVE